MPSRRAFLAATGASVALAGCLDALPADSPYTAGDERTDWPMPGYDRASGGFVPRGEAPRSSPSVRWSVDSGWLSGPPVVTDGTVVAPDHDGLTARDAADGTEQWSVTFGDGGVVAKPAIHDGTVYTATRRGFGAFSLSDGTEQWNVETRAGVHAPPTFSHDAEWLYVGDDDGWVYQLDPATGDRGHERQFFAGVNQLAFDGTLVVGTTGGEVYSLYDDGDRLRGLWRRKLGGEVTGMAADSNDVTVTTFGGPVYKLAGGAHAGSNRWTGTGGGGVAVGMQDVVTAYGGGVRVLDRYGGETRWSRDGRYEGGPVLAGDTVYAGSERGVEAYAVRDSVGGNRRWLFETDSLVDHLVVAAGAVLASTTGATDGAPSMLYALE